MVNGLKYMRWVDALKHWKKQLDETVEKAKTVNSNYQKYLKANPYKNEKKDLANRRKKFTQKILDLVEQGYERYDGK